MMNYRQTKRFRTAVKRMHKRGKSIKKLKTITEMVYSNILHRKHQDHVLKGTWSGHRECHIEADWLLVYRWENDVLVLVDTGSHADIFGW